MAKKNENKFLNSENRKAAVITGIDAALSIVDGKVDISTLSDTQKRELLVQLVGCSFVLKGLVETSLEKVKEAVPESFFSGTEDYCGMSIDMKVKQTFVCDTINCTREELLKTHAFTSDMVKEKTTTIFSLEKAAIEEAYNQKSNVVMDAIAKKVFTCEYVPEKKISVKIK